MRDILLSWVRTIVPLVVGFLVSKGLLDENSSTEALAAGYVIVTSAYYVAVRVLETKFSWVGWLLGAPKAPSY